MIDVQALPGFCCRFVWSPSNRYSFEDRYCYESRFATPVYDSELDKVVYLKQKCCYDTDWGSNYPLLVNAPRGGNLLVVSIVYSTCDEYYTFHMVMVINLLHKHTRPSNNVFMHVSLTGFQFHWSDT